VAVGLEEQLAVELGVPPPVVPDQGVFGLDVVEEDQLAARA
jgi:hypothetical protein